MMSHEMKEHVTSANMVKLIKMETVSSYKK